MRVSSAHAIMTGIAPDGGLFVPCEIPKLRTADFPELAKMPYSVLAARILSMYLTDYSYDELQDCADSAYSKEKFGSDSVAPVYKLNDTAYVLELWHGPTCAFKDMALQILPHLLTRAVKKSGEKKDILILVATSGDTGKAALAGFSDVPGTKILVFYPKDGVSAIQKLQMTTQEGANVGVAAVRGNFDDAQTGVKQIFGNPDCAKEAAKANCLFSSANSINWGRLAPQIVYYIAAYADLFRNGEIASGEAVNIVVPTGNFGNILAAYYAKQMGLPVHKLICASNQNNVLTDFINTGVYDKNRTFFTTISPSMDILISSNLERFLFLASGRDDKLVRGLMEQLKATGRYTVPQTIKQALNSTFYAGFATDQETKAAIANTFTSDAYLMDTHTAVAKFVYDRYVDETGDKTKTIIASTANPYKFNESVLTAIAGPEAALDADEFALLDRLEKVSGQPIPAALKDLKQKPARFDAAYEKDQLFFATKNFLTN